MEISACSLQTSPVKKYVSLLSTAMHMIIIIGDKSIMLFRILIE